MKRLALFSLVSTVLVLVVGGCVKTGTAVRVSGTPRSMFTLKYVVGGNPGVITTATRAEPTTVLDWDVPGQDLSTCEVTKREASAQLLVEIEQAGRSVCRAEAPAGTQGVRISQTATGWRQERF